MSKVKVLSIALLAAATLAGPAMAREHVVPARQAQTDTDAAQTPVSGAAGCVSAPRVGAFASDPWTNGNVPCEPASAR